MHVITELEIEEAILRGQLDDMLSKREREINEQLILQQRNKIKNELNGMGVK